VHPVHIHSLAKFLLVSTYKRFSGSVLFRSKATREAIAEMKVSLCARCVCNNNRVVYLSIKQSKVVIAVVNVNIKENLDINPTWLTVKHRPQMCFLMDTVAIQNGYRHDNRFKYCERNSLIEAPVTIKQLLVTPQCCHLMALD
jgi:hypothetical protein